MTGEYTYDIYVEQVTSGEIPACRSVVAAVERHVNDLSQVGDTDFHFDRASAEHVIDFFYFLRHSKGEWAGQVIRLEPWQQFVLAMLFGWKRSDGTRRFRTSYLEVARKNGKALALDTMLATPTGWTTMGDVSVGSSLFDEAGKVCRVTAVTDVMADRPCYAVRFSDGETIVADELHQWRVEERNRLGYRILTTGEMSRSVLYDERKAERRYRIDVAGALDLSQSVLPVPPYTLGVWLGDGHSDSARVTIPYQNAGILAKVADEGVSVSEGVSSSESSGLFLLGSGGRGKKERDRSLQATLRRMGVQGDKHIPAIYLRSSIAQRTELLRGLMDTDGHVSRAGQCEYTTVSERLCSGVVELLRTLGYKPSVMVGRAKLYGRDVGPKFRILFNGYAGNPVCSLVRKFSRLKPTPAFATRASHRQIVSIEPVSSVPVRCIEVDSPSSLFLAGRAMIPTHNSTLSAGVGLYLMNADGEGGAEIYSAATKRAQAKITFDEATRMVKSSPFLRRRVNTFRDNLHIRDTASKFEPLGRDANSMDGLNIHGAIVDELHAHKTREVWDVLETATGSRRQPLMFAITTAGHDRKSICWELHEYTEKVLAGLIDDPSWFGMIFTVDDDAQWDSRVEWAKANPNLGVSVSLADLETKAQKAKQMPSALNSFLRLHLDVWTQVENRWMNPDKWRSCGAQVNEDGLRGRTCYAGLDLASTTDVSGYALVFPPESRGDRYKVLWRFFIPDESMHERSRRDRVPYEAWVREGYITTTPGNVIDFDFIVSSLDDDAQRFDIKEVAFDRWGAAAIQTKLMELGGDDWLVQFGQGFASMASPMRELERIVLDNLLAHGNNPVASWMVDNVVAAADPAGNLKPDKAKSHEKIDGVVMLLMGLDRASRHQVKRPSVYERRGITVI